MHRLLGLIAALWICAAALAAPLPGDAPALIPQLKTELASFWPGVQPRAWVPALIEQESGWKTHAQLKTSRELGCGLGQFTKAYDAAGRVRFDALAEARGLDRSLVGWTWRDCARAQYQLRAVVLKLRVNDRQCAPLMADNRSAKACAAAMYNGGAGSVARRIRSCQAQSGCQPGVWFGQLERQCPQGRAKAAGYGESFCDINSRYPARVEARMWRYSEVMR
ncbi:hypothetical protein [Amantichitinum ursilacus]|uniref:Transglycosylase SLT domain protein n=1 Tax=Amantichitinum ursilacus TaxID=857265 RepID=A0A0N0GNQ2_9NEIS|nr:hypothetical protein [Amantichitinum ursilacus]KPC53042.1 hypothetical protein WG78_11145 [Amantichitinum ursilacus]